jgi:hypothetical protein
MRFREFVGAEVWSVDCRVLLIERAESIDYENKRIQSMKSL